MDATEMIERLAANSERRGECIVWTGNCRPNGYGRVTISRRKSLSAHRLAYTLSVGEIPEGMHVCHRCDNRPCINPAHLFLGTALDNMRDKVAKGRQARGEGHGFHTTPEARPRGEGHGLAKLTAEQVAEIRRRYIPRKVTMRALAAEYGISSSNVCFIVHGATWTE